MSACNDLFNGASKKRKILDAPTKLYPKCHPKASLDVFADVSNHTIILCCSKCDRRISIIQAKGPFNGDIQNK